MRRRRWLWILGGVLAVTAVALGAAWAAGSLVTSRRRILTKQAESEVVAVAEAVATIVRDRERDISRDLTRVIDITERGGRPKERTLEIVRANLIGMNRSTSRYLRLWYLENGKVQTEVSGFRQPEELIPNVSVAELSEVDMDARSDPGTIATFQAILPIDSPYSSLRLVALSNEDGEGTVVILVNMDSLFDALQARATLPNLDLWVMDKDGSLLVDPDSPRRKEVLDTVRNGPPNGLTRLGPEPSLWPFSSTGLDSQILVWRTSSGRPFPWVTAVAAPLDTVTQEVHAVAAVVLLVAALVLMLAIVAAGLVFYLANRQAQYQERLRSLATIDRLREQLLHLEKLSTIGQVAAGVAHEMGTPLGVIAIRIEQLLERAPDDRQKNALTVMREQIERINRIIRQLLDSSRPTAARMAEIPVHVAAAQVAELVSQRYETKKLGLKVEVAASVRAFANPDQFQQVLLNLLINAGDACRHGDKVEVRIVDTRDDAGRIGVEVVDTGPGIPADVLPSVFEPFFTTKPPGEGTGLGLTIVREILERHHGRVELKSSAAGTRAITWWHPRDPQLDDTAEPSRNAKPATLSGS